MNEHSFIHSIHRYLKKSQDIDIWKINASFANGVPDAWYAGNKTDIWIEYKYLKTWPKRDRTKIDLTNPAKFLSIPQQKWLERKYNLGISVAVVLGVADDVVILEGLAWKVTKDTKELRSLALSREQAAQWILSYCLHRGEHEEHNRERR